MTLASIITPKWVTYTVQSPSGGTVYDTIGLHRRCTSSTDTCAPFPDPARCRDGHGGGASFCSMWRTTGWLMSFATVAELAAVIGFLIVMVGGRVKREGRWKILGGMLVAVAVAQFLGMAVVVSSEFFLSVFRGTADGYRPISLTTTTSFWCRGIGSTRRGICAHSVRVLRC